MVYVIHYDICAFILLGLLAVPFYARRRFFDTLARLFSALLITATVNVALDIAGACAVNYAERFPIILTVLLNTAYFASQTVLVALMFAFTMSAGGFTKKAVLRSLPLFLPATAMLGAMITNPFTGWFFTVDREKGFLHGEYSLLIYACSAFYLLLSLVFALCRRKRFVRLQFPALLICLGTVTVSTVLQYVLESYLLIGLGIAFSLMMMSFTVQNPADMVDPGTGLFSYAAMNQFLRINAGRNRKLYLIAVDLCNVESISSTLGVTARGNLISQVGAFFSATAGKENYVFNMVGTRYLIATYSEKEYYTQRVVTEQRFAKPWTVGDQTVMLSATIRCYVQEKYSNVKDVIGVIDMAFDEVTDETRGTLADVDEECFSRGKRRFAVERAVRHALESGEGFYICLQPIYNREKKAFTGAEALLRLQSPELGLVMPGEFISVASSRGMLRKIDSVVIRKVCGYLSDHPEVRDMGLETISVNISSADFFSSAGDNINTALREYGVSPGRITVEITENVVLNNYNAAAHMMRKMKEDGYSFSLDDFGTGYSNIVRVQSLPFDAVKIDRSLAISENHVGKAVFEDILALMKRLGTRVVVEGTETAEQVERASFLGADFIQGFYYARPMETDAFTEFMRKSRESA